jgi:hypothetical protein
VLVVGMPMGDRQANRVTDGWAGVEVVNGRIGAAALEGGAIGFIDLSDFLPNRRFVGGHIHVDYEGSWRFTRAVMEELARLEG